MAPVPSAKALWFDTCSSEWVMAEQPEAGPKQPSLPASGSLLLSPLDHFSAHAYGYTVYAFVFPKLLDARVVRRALARLLPWYPVLAGRAVSSPASEGSTGVSVAWDLSTQGVELLTATSPVSAADIVLQRCTASGGTAPAVMQPQVVADLSVLHEALSRDWSTVLDQDMQLSRFTLCSLAPPGGNTGGGAGAALLGFAVQHAVMDGHSMRLFMEQWAAECRALAQALGGGTGTGILAGVVPTFGRQCWEQLVQHAHQGLGLCNEQPCPQHPVMGLAPPAGQQPQQGGDDDQQQQEAVAQRPPGEFAAAAERKQGSSSSDAVVGGEGAGPKAGSNERGRMFVGPRTATAAATPPWGNMAALHFSAAHLAALKARALADLERGTPGMHVSSDSPNDSG
eukprot:CAMPEP_0202877782 /NCGR_PEP_ID=MMETSP1391-20130828/31145_1 /ASSEMBLY_ACC=CAM_ASM_000867 /TAXON_ID=1034604 /ORGANISM="Chlamydomonas leiostraca, Strain SAG 11-49" /LENGTH=396 /DNA_ID=CAMNT_0049559873 /DNA_START=89 /DNA_END=1275 /DNA_ORIENTATION=-